MRAEILRPGFSRESALAATCAIGVVLVVKFAAALVRLLGNAVAYDPSAYAGGFLGSPVGLFLGELVLYPFPFYLAAVVALAAFFPLRRTLPIRTVVLRAIGAGVVGTVVLMLVGIVTGIVLAASRGDAVWIVLYVVFIPLAAGVLLTPLLVAGSVVAWLWLARLESARAGSLEAQDPDGRDPAPVTPLDAGPVAAAAPVGSAFAMPGSSESVGSAVAPTSAPNPRAATGQSAGTSRTEPSPKPADLPPRGVPRVVRPTAAATAAAGQPSVGPAAEQSTARPAAAAPAAAGPTASPSAPSAPEVPLGLQPDPVAEPGAAPGRPTPPASDNPFLPPDGR